MNENKRAADYLNMFAKLTRSLMQYSEKFEITLFEELEICRWYLQLETLRFGNKVNVDFDLDTYLKMLKPQGQFCLVSQPLNKLAVNAGLLYDYAQRVIYGNYTGSRKDMVDMLAFSAKHNIESNVNVMPFSKMNEAIEIVRGGESTLKLVLESRK